ncbi:MAG: N-6 DNA methylase, partial [Gammaproteobacteria bacterium]|nr:N-6 DNA methylase [Gammaproteobacteria bacterium]
RDDLNPSVSEDDAIEMLAQHIITKPVFDAMFEEYSFAETNSIAGALDKVLNAIHAKSLEGERETLERFYSSVKRRAAGLKTVEAKQKVIVQLYDKFFRTAFPAMTQKLGIVYTPVEVVDFIIHSVNDVLKSEFDQTLGSRGVHILDPFTGTGTFITRLLQSGLIKPEELEHKYKHEIHANEIVLLAYYIAAINIEAVYHEIAKENTGGVDVPYTPFDGIVLTDTFQLYEQEKDMIADLLPDNSERRTAQKERDIRVIVGNPPYSVGQSSDNDNASNVDYPELKRSVQNTYVKYSTGNPRSLYDSYILALRWASNRIQEKGDDRGIVAFVSSAGWVDSNAADGLRKCLLDEFSSLYIFHLRGNARTAGEQRRKEKGNVFGEGTRTPIAISILVRNPDAAEQGKILFHDIGDYLDQKEKLAIVRSFKSLAGISEKKGWRIITPDEHNDWLNQVDRTFEKYWSIGDKKDKQASTVFDNYSRGIATNRDAWAFNSSPNSVAVNMLKLANNYNAMIDSSQEDKTQKPDAFMNNDATQMCWSWVLREKFRKGVRAEYNADRIIPAMYRPFSKQNLYYDGFLNENRYLFPKLFPTGREQNRIITMKGVGGGGDFNAYMTNAVYCLQPNHGTQCFPLKLYEPASAEDGLFASGETGYTERDGISDAGQKHFQDAYPSEQISKEDLFYYIYGLLHSPDYSERFENNLSKELPRIPAVKTAADFWAFSKAGRALGDLHVNYETVEPYPVVIKEGSL